MSFTQPLVASILVLVALAVASTQPAPAPAKPVRLVQPWSKLTSLTDVQKTQIYKIHQQFLEEHRQLKQREEQQILTLLTQQQKNELKQLLEQQKIDRKTKDAARRAQKTKTSTNSD